MTGPSVRASCSSSGGPVHVVGAEHHVHVRRPLPHQVAVLLGEAAGHHDLEARALRLERLQVAEGAVQLVVGVLPDAAGVEDDDVRVLGTLGLGQPVGLEEARRCATSRARSSGTRRCGWRRCAAPWRSRVYGEATRGLRGAWERSADGQPRGHRPGLRRDGPPHRVGHGRHRRRGGPAPLPRAAPALVLGRHLARGLGRDRADPDQAGPPRATAPTSRWATGHPTTTPAPPSARATLVTDDETRVLAVGGVHGRRPAPVGYDPAIIPPWAAGPTSDAFAALRLDPWRLRVMPGTVMTAGQGSVLTWRA